MSQFLDLTKLKKSIHVTKPQLKHELKPQSQKEDIINLKTLKKINLPQVNLNKVNLTKLNPTKVTELIKSICFIMKYINNKPVVGLNV
jgi:hypothetical protein